MMRMANHTTENIYLMKQQVDYGQYIGTKVDYAPHQPELLVARVIQLKFRPWQHIVIEQDQIQGHTPFSSVDSSMTCSPSLLRLFPCLKSNIGF
jgi:hypothetical protein